ncbi:MAG: ATP-binding cassette domain-containing protein [Acidobacteria bacterium]|nr:MAG: ATP-binding cassette domain-containing protein [Acidobacteriota bacterium]
MLEIRDIYKTFNPDTPDEVKALQGVTFRMEEGSFVAVLGTNGSGKSTLLNAVAGSFQVDFGKILLGGEDITALSEHQRARHIGRVFQNPFTGTAPDMSIAENLALASLRGRKRGLGWAVSSRTAEEFKARIRELNMGLEDRLGNIIGKLSGGQRQALTLLMASWLKPKLLLLDEHTAALDPKTAKKVIELTEQIIEKDHLTTLMVTHSMQQAVNLGDRLIMMNKGKIIYDFRGDEKRRLRANDLLALFDEVRRKEQIDHTTAEMLSRVYV